MSLQVTSIDWERDKRKLLDIEHSAFADTASDEADLFRQIQKGFGFIAIDGSDPKGYAIAIPLEKAPYAGCVDDRFKGRNDTAYIESLAVKEGSNPSTLLRLVRAVGGELASRNYTRATMHVKSGDRLHQTLRNFGAIDLESFDNWMGWGERFSYLEIPLQ